MFEAGQRVTTEWGTGTVREFTHRRILIDLDGETSPLNIVTGSHGFDRIQSV